ncbi:hypothetical protein PBI_OAKER_21 [Mycobacterium phage Oaker]|uniref:Uncharacterized protein n=1 Tax=Mycobacterium phage Konstantine TaxID=563121 RepID=B5U4Z6_9CAUD|nr:gp26 [Mycobacterium phage Konstantine]YP_009007302.1 hypothetical protein CH12_gp21 [Mycobacterium phage Oaker]ACI12442.1 hypothetical protein KONSTANTINE_26 [Mycobacterium phage Konstantine]AHG24412.1 hypothetical protein PBI_OAKER_21 [Mycobacterium phage Oaker]AXH47146.1 hypothetical protein SEA_CBORCH11_22 [Mycobacterium phage Cborch11]
MAQRPAGSPSTAELVENTPDDRDVAERAPAPNTSGKRVRAIPTHGGTAVKVSRRDFESLGVKGQSDVEWNFRKDKFTVAVGSEKGQISEEAAKVLTAHEPTRFEFITQ